MTITNSPVKIDKVTSLAIAQQGEQSASQIRFDMTDWLAVYPNGAVFIYFKRPGETTARVVSSTLEGAILTWTVGTWEALYLGIGFVEVRLLDSEGGTLAKSRIIPCSVEDSLPDSDESDYVPTAVKTWVQNELDNQLETLQEQYEAWASGYSEEIEDARTGADGVTDTLVGDSVRRQISGICDRLDALEYEAIKFTTALIKEDASATGSTTMVVEIGTTVDSLFIQWALNKTPATLKIAGESQTPAASGTLWKQGSYTSNTTFSLVATDAEGASDTKSLNLRFYNGVYHGVSVVDTINNAFVQSMTRSLQAARASEFTVTAGSGQYIWFALPSSYGTPTFNVGGFEGGFTLAATITFTNFSSYDQEYKVYRSDNAGLGTVKVTVT